MEKAKSKAYCPKCKSKNLIVRETITASTTVIQKDGLIDPKTCNNEYGNPFKVEALCDDCGYEWVIDGAIQITDIFVDSEDVYVYNSHN